MLAEKMKKPKLSKVYGDVYLLTIRLFYFYKKQLFWVWLLSHPNRRNLSEVLNAFSLALSRPSVDSIYLPFWVKMVTTRKKVYTTGFAAPNQKSTTVRKCTRSSSSLTPAPDSNQKAAPDSNQNAAPDSNQTAAPDSSQKAAPPNTLAASVPAATSCSDGNSPASRLSNSRSATSTTFTTPDAPATARTSDAAMPHRKPSCIKEPKSHLYRVRQKRPSASSDSHRAAKKREYFQFDCQFDLILYSIWVSIWFGFVFNLSVNLIRLCFQFDCQFDSSEFSIWLSIWFVCVFNLIVNLILWYLD